MSLRIELDKEFEKKFRELAMKKYGYSKGSIKKATELALKRWTEDVKKESERKNEEKDTVVKALKLLKQGINMGGIMYKTRDELHER